MLPVSPSIYVNRLLNPAYTAIKEVIPSAKIGGGVTAPRGGTGGMSPLAFLRGITERAAGWTHMRITRTRVWPTETPRQAAAGTTRPSRWRRSDASSTRSLARIRKPASGSRNTVADEPPDRLLGVSPAKQARYLAEAARRAAVLPRVDLLVHYLYRDEPSLGRWQSGLTTVRKAEAGARGGDAAARPGLAQGFDDGRLGPGATWLRAPSATACRFHRGGRWSALGGVRLTNAGGSFTIPLTASRGSVLRLWYPARRLAGLRDRGALSRQGC